MRLKKFTVQRDVFRQLPVLSYLSRETEVDPLSVEVCFHQRNKNY